MSKAKEWEKRLEEFKEDRPALHLPHDSEDEPSADVDDYGCLEIHHRTAWSSKDALALARWILDTFGD